MRQIGTIANESEAQRLTDYLLTRGIKAQIERQGADWAVWVFDEDRVPESREELQRFVQNPEEARYVDAQRQARDLREEALRKDLAYRKNLIDARRLWKPSASRTPLTWLLLGASVVVAFMSDFGDDRSHRSILQDLLFSSFRHTDDGHIQWWSPISPRGDLRRGQYWRLVTPIFVHFGTPHLLMNMFALISLGTVLEARRGTWRFGLLVLVTAVTSNVAEYAWSQIPTFGGMSGVLFGVFGYLWIKSEFDPGFGIRLAPTSIAMMLIWFVLCMTTNWFGSIANAAHFAGLVTGIVWSGAPLVWRRFRSR